MRACLLPVLAAFALAGCQSAAEKQAAATGEIHAANASTKEVAGLIKAAAEKNAAQPGLWQASLKIDAVDLGGAGDDAAQLQAAKALERDSRECRSADQLKPVDVTKLEQAAGGECVFERYDMAGGRIDAQVVCRKGQGRETHVAIHGTTSPTGFDVATENRSGKPGERGYALIKLRSSGKRLGACQA